MSRGDDDYNISASQVKAHSKCPLQWWFRYRSETEPSKKESVYLNLGSRVHEAIEEALTAESPPPLGHREAVKAAIQNKYRELGWKYELPDDHFGDGLGYCETAADYISKRNPSIDDVENRIEYTINNPELTTGVTAIIDVVSEGEIWDWKTGRIRDDTPHEEKIQGATYMAAYYHEYGEEPDAIRFIYLKEGKVRSVEVGDQIWEYMLKYAKELVEGKKANSFPGRPGDHCYWCEYEFFCPEAKVGMGGVDPEDY